MGQSQWKNPASPGQFSVELNILLITRPGTVPSDLYTETAAPNGFATENGRFRQKGRSSRLSQVQIDTTENRSNTFVYHILTDHSFTVNRTVVNQLDIRNSGGATHGHVPIRLPE